MQFAPCLDQPPLPSWQRTRDHLNRINAKNPDPILIVCVEVRNMVGRTCFGKHTNNDPKEPAQLWHESILLRGGRVRASLARRERFLIELATGGDLRRLGG